MPSIDERLEAVTHTLELVAQMQQRTESVVNSLAEAQAKTDRAMSRLERVMSRLAVFTIDHEQRLQSLEGAQE
jgi:hypothetical protein